MAREPMNEPEARLFIHALLLVGEAAGVAKAHGMLRPGQADEFIVAAGEDALNLFTTWADETGVDVREIVTDFFAERLSDRAQLPASQSGGGE